MHASDLSPLGASVLPLYFLVTIAIGLLARRRSRSSGDYLNASRSLPLWIVSASFLSANCGALEIVGLSAMAAEYGVQAFHFYWIGAIPGMIFVSLWMIPIYMKSGVRSVPEYLEVRYGVRLRLLNACVTAITVLLLAGISLFAMAQVAQVILDFSFRAAVLISAGVVLVYALAGGVRATIYNEVFQLAVMLAGLVPLFLRSRHLLQIPASPVTTQNHLWLSLPLVSSKSPMDMMGVVAGLGFVLSFSYWGTDFVLIQRALASRSLAEARQVPLWAGFGKLLFSLIVVVPGLVAFRAIHGLGSVHRFDQALPEMMRRFYGPAMLGLGMTALLASLMSGLAANISAFAAVWTEDIYKAHLRPGRSERHYLRMGFAALVFATLISIANSSVSFYFSNLMEHVQLIFSLFGAPFWAIFLLGMATRKTTAWGALIGFLAGFGVALFHQICVELHWIAYGSQMSTTFHAAIYAFSTAVAVALLISHILPEPDSSQNQVLVFRFAEALTGRNVRALLALSTLLLIACIALNVIWR
jgi:solute:Na+ symporter, SSS family